MLYPDRFVSWPTKYAGLKGLLLACLMVFAVLCVSRQRMQAHDIISTNLTYSREVSRILARRCAGCHTKADSIPLTNYAEVRPWAVAIKEQVLTRAMPPWGAVKGFGDLEPDNALSQEEVMTIAEWVIGGSPEGSKLLLPAAVGQTRARAAAAPAGEMIAVKDRLSLSRDVAVAALKPESSRRVESAQIVARLPDGEILPLLWLYQYEPKWETRFRFRSTVMLPKGTVVEASAPVSFGLEAHGNPLSHGSRLGKVAAQ